MKFIVNGTPVEIEETAENLRECANALRRNCLNHRHYDNNRDNYRCDTGCFRYCNCLIVNNQKPFI